MYIIYIVLTALTVASRDHTRVSSSAGLTSETIYIYVATCIAVNIYVYIVVHRYKYYIYTTHRLDGSLARPYESEKLRRLDVIDYVSVYIDIYICIAVYIYI